MDRGCRRKLYRVIGMLRRRARMHGEDVRISVERCEALHTSLGDTHLTFEGSQVMRTTNTIGGVERVDESGDMPIAVDPVPASLRE
jgi:hypothetical protein